MLKLVIGNRAYSSWSLRGWLAARHAGLPFEEIFFPLYEADWEQRRRDPLLAPSGGKVPILWDGAVASWHALAIIDHLDRLTGGARFWPADPAARAFAMSVAAEMQSSFQALRGFCPMNTRRRYPGYALSKEAEADTRRVEALWEEGLDRFGGPWIAGADYGAADIMFTPVASRFTTYDVALSAPAEALRARLMAHPFTCAWLAAAATEGHVLERYEF
ncbi:glutathione S-transferase [Thermaurantiacus sp.]